MDRTRASADGLIRKARFLELYAHWVWPLHRLFVRKHLSKRCKNCAASERFSPLDSSGLCRECQNPLGVQKEAVSQSVDLKSLEEEFDTLMRSFQGRGKGDYDALVLLSGGKDSAFLLYQLKNKFPGLRLLAITFDNHFLSPVALANAQQVVTRLNIDHCIFRPALALYQKTFRYACTHLEPGKGCFEIVDRMDANLGFDMAKNFAASHRVPLLISGLSWIQGQYLFGAESFEVPRERVMKKTQETIGKRIEDLYEGDELKYWWNPSRYPESDIPRFILPFFVWRHDESYIRKRVLELDLIPAGNDSPLVTNCTFIPVMVMIDFLHLGYASFEPQFAQMVREGRAERLFWKRIFEISEYSSKTGWFLESEIKGILAQLGLTKGDLGIKS